VRHHKNQVKKFERPDPVCGSTNKESKMEGNETISVTENEASIVKLFLIILELQQ